MRLGFILLSLCIVGHVQLISGQARKPSAVRAAPTPVPPVPPIREVPQVTCPSPLGVGARTKLTFCDVVTGRDPGAGILIALPPHRGTVSLTFDLHNRHTYSEDQAKDRRAAYARYTASVGALTMDNTLISRAAIQSEFRTLDDFVDRIGGGAGPSGLKAVAPTGKETVSLTIPEAEMQVSILGEKLMVERADGRANYTSAGRPIAIISNLTIEYLPPLPPRPAPPARKPAAKAPARRPSR